MIRRFLLEFRGTRFYLVSGNLYRFLVQYSLDLVLELLADQAVFAMLFVLVFRDHCTIYTTRLHPTRGFSKSEMTLFIFLLGRMDLLFSMNSLRFGRFRTNTYL
jgi:hypothetical protein